MRQRQGRAVPDSTQAAAKGLSHFLWMHKLTGSDSEGLVEREKVEGHYEQPQGGKTMLENE